MATKRFKLSKERVLLDHEILLYQNSYLNTYIHAHTQTLQLNAHILVTYPKLLKIHLPLGITKALILEYSLTYFRQQIRILYATVRAPFKLTHAHFVAVRSPRDTLLWQNALKILKQT